MLWTTPESLHEKLPLTNKSGDLTITADARIDNRDELISTLNYNGRPRETITDSEIILAAYEKWGEKYPEKLLGDFSFAIYDKRKQIVYCARDPIGIKPFYYYFNGKTFRWSSEPKAIFEDKAIPKEPNLQLICLYLLNRFDEREETLYKDIYRLPPSHFMTLENGKLRKGQHWDIDPNHTIRYKTDEEYAEHFLTLFKDAVRVRLRSHGPVGALLSGGLDSSSIVCTAQMLYREKSISNNGFETFSIVFDRLPCNERQYIKEVVNKWNIKANYIPYEQNLSWVDFERIYDYSDVSYFTTFFMISPAFKNANQKKIRIMLGGFGGDDLLAPDVNHLTDLIIQRRIRELMTQLRFDAALYSCSPYFLFLNYCIKPLIPQPIKLMIKQFLKPFRRNWIPSYININFLKHINLIDRIKRQQKTKKFPTYAQNHIYYTLYYGWNINWGLDVIERLAAYLGIEIRHPFFDKRVVEFSFGLPEEQRWCGEWSKTVLREAMKKILPESLRKRKDKADFSSIVDQELKQRQLSKLEELIEFSYLAKIGAIHPNQIKQHFKNYCNGTTHDNGRNDLEAILGFELWYRSQWVV
jgi:asparagine synthase (glutamine-hydrolysing)